MANKIIYRNKINKEPINNRIANGGGVGFRVRAALSGDAPHKSGRDPLVIRFLSNRSNDSTPTYDNVPDKPCYTNLVILGLGSFHTSRNLSNFFQLI